MTGPGRWQMWAITDGMPLGGVAAYTDAFSINLELPNELRTVLRDDFLTIYINGFQVFRMSTAEIEYAVNAATSYDAEGNLLQGHIEFVPARFGVAVENGLIPDFPLTNVNVKVQVNEAIRSD